MDARALKAMLADGRELALIDVREELVFSQNHLLFARSVPLSRLELRFARLVPRRTTRIVLCDDADGMAERAAGILARAGYTDVAVLDGGVAAWAAAGFELFSGVNVPSKAFGEFVEHASATPSIAADELDRLIRAGTDMVVLDSRPFDEYQRVSIPTAVNVPGAELALRIHDLAPSPQTLVVVNCAGRTRSIIGAQSLINAGVPNKVVALRNGTMGWTLAGLACESGKARRAPGVSSDGLAWAKSAAARVADRFGITRIDRGTLERWRADGERTLYLLDVRDPGEYEAGHIAGAVSAPGGQLVQATDQYVGTLGARIVLVDDAEVRAVMTASWLRQMGWSDVAVLVEAGGETGRPGAPVLGSAPAPELRIDGDGLAALHRAGSSDRRRSLAQPRLPQGAHSRRLVRDPLAARARLRQNTAARHAGADVGGWRARRPRRQRGPGAGRHACACARRRQRRVARGRACADRRRPEDGRRCHRHLAQALRALEGHDQGDAGVSVVGGGPAGAYRARRLGAVCEPVVSGVSGATSTAFAPNSASTFPRRQRPWRSGNTRPPARAPREPLTRP